MRIIHRTDQGYELEHFGEADGEVYTLFGTWVLPLPFTPHADAKAVLADQQARTDQDVFLCECAQ